MVGHIVQAESQVAFPGVGFPGAQYAGRPPCSDVQIWIEIEIEIQMQMQI